MSVVETFTAVAACYLIYLTALCSADICDTDPNISCAKDVANTLLSLQNAVSQKQLVTRGLLDVVFVIDEGSLTSSQHYWLKQFILVLSEIFVISPEYTRASVVTYSTAARVIIPFSDNADMCSFTPNITSMSLKAGYSYLSAGLNAAIGQLNSGRKSATKLTILVTNGDWGNLGSKPETSINQVKALGYFATIILKHPGQSLGLVRDVIFDYFVSFFGSKRLSFTVDMTPEYLRDLHNIIKYNKAMSSDWPLDLEVSIDRCKNTGRICAVNTRCVCEVRTIFSEYICVGDDKDPPESVLCEGPKSPIYLGINSTSTDVTWPQPVFSDDSGSVSVITNKFPGLFQAGVHTVTSTARDKNMNAATCTFRFIVNK